MRIFSKPEINYHKRLPQEKLLASNGDDILIIYDQILLEIPDFKNWLTMFENTYEMTGGESLKSLESFPEHFHNLSDKIPGASRNGLKIVAVGGGSVGDFAGFFASVYKRGVSLIHIPTTWLAAIDSAHGGKNALNSSESKNQLGTFYFPEKVFICKNILNYLPADQILSGYGEVVKTALLSGEEIWNSLPNKDNVDVEKLWALLPSLVDYKYQIVKKDPFEDTDIRRVLNLGHTLGHVLEKQFELLHGEAVAQGTHFSIDWSYEKKFLKKDEYKKIKNHLESFFPCMKESLCSRITKDKALQLLMTDKKLDINQQLNFVFLKGLGQPVVEKIEVNEIIAKLYQQSWVN